MVRAVLGSHQTSGCVESDFYSDMGFGATWAGLHISESFRNFYTQQALKFT